MDKNVCCFSEGMITLPEGFFERTLNTLMDKRGALPPVTLSRDTLGNHNNIEEYIESQLNILKKQVKDWHQAAHQPAVLGDNAAIGLIIAYDFLRPDNLHLYQKQAVFSLDMENLLIFSQSKASAFTEEDEQRFITILESFRLHA